MRSMNGLTPQQQAQLQAQGGELGGQGRPQSPMSSDAAPSPKRPRVDGPGFGTPQMNAGVRNAGGPMQMPNGPGQTPGMMPNALDPMSAPFNGMNPGQNKMQQFGVHRNFPGGMKNEFGGGPGMIDNYDNMELLNSDSMRMTTGATPQGGALADYQMQLMLLEQQNKRRLMMARQEQSETSSGGPPGTTQALMGGPPYPPGLSPRRNGQSPSPNDPMKRGNSNMGQSSPRPEGQMPITRRSPAPGSFDPTGMPPGVNPQFFHPGQTKMGDGMGGPNGMRPGAPGFPGPGANFNQQMELMRARGQAGMPPGSFGGQGAQGPQAQGNLSQVAQQNLNNSQQNPMPPPQPPNAGANAAGRTNPSSPQQNANPPTPSQTKAANPKANKKDAAKDKKVSTRLFSSALAEDANIALQAKQNKKAPNATAAVPTSEAEGNGPPTPTPPTPITPVAHDNPFGSNPKNGQRHSNGQPQPQTNGAAPNMLGQPDVPTFGLEGGHVCISRHSSLLTILTNRVRMTCLTLEPNSVKAATCLPTLTFRHSCTIHRMLLLVSMRLASILAMKASRWAQEMRKSTLQ